MKSALLSLLEDEQLAQRQVRRMADYLASIINSMPSVNPPSG